MNIQPIEVFHEIVNPNLELVTALMRDTWQPPCWRYEPDLLAMHIQRPTGDPSMAVGLVTPDGRLASYLAFVPLQVRLHGHPYRAVFASFFTVSTAFRHYRLSDRQQNLMLDRAIARGFDLYLAVTVAGTPANQTVARAFRGHGLPVEAISSFRYLVGVPAIMESRLPSVATAAKVRLYEPGDEESAYQLLAQASMMADLSRVIARADIDFMLRTRPRVRTYVGVQEGRPTALLNVAFLPIVGELPSVNAYLENIALGTLSPHERAEFVATVLRRVLATGVDAVMVADIGYADLAVFRALGFRAAPRGLRLLLGALRPGVLGSVATTVASFCLDVY
ncbi:MAG: hypothetical protein ACYCXG_06635 [Acidiferrobacter sp.]